MITRGTIKNINIENTVKALYRLGHIWLRKSILFQCEHDIHIWMISNAI